jgi:hypothetical protein
VKDFTFGPRDKPCLRWASPNVMKLLRCSRPGNLPTNKYIPTVSKSTSGHRAVCRCSASTPHFLASASAIATSTAGLPRGPRRRPERLSLRGAGSSLDERLCLPNNNCIETGWLAILCRFIIMCLQPANTPASELILALDTAQARARRCDDGLVGVSGLPAKKAPVEPAVKSMHLHPSRVHAALQRPASACRTTHLSIARHDR